LTGAGLLKSGEGGGKMRTLIAYATKYGCTEKCAQRLAAILDGEVELCNLQKKKVSNLAFYNRVIVGGSIYMGKIQKEVSNFCREHLNALRDKKIGLFICGMAESEEAAKELNGAFPPELADTAVAREIFGGEFIFSKMNFIHRKIVKKVAKTEHDVSKIAGEKIEQFARRLQE